MDLDELYAEYGVDAFFTALAANPAEELGGDWVTDERLPRFVEIYLPSTIEYVGNAAFGSMWISGVFLLENMLEVSDLPEFDYSFAYSRYVSQIYLPDKATQEQVDAMDGFFPGQRKSGASAGGTLA